MSQENRKPIPDFFPGDMPLFLRGQLVMHARYGYRAVVVDFDVRCLADEEWYQGNRTQPAREQPWYHLLVNASDAATYAAESNLLPDDSGEVILHPLVAEYFEAFSAGRYIRNDRSWPTWPGAGN